MSLQQQTLGTLPGLPPRETSRETPESVTKDLSVETAVEETRPREYEPLLARQYVPTHTRTRREHTVSLLFPTILIGLGAIFLLNNMGWISWEVWEGIANLWPILLIAAGLDIMIGRRSMVGSVGVVLLTLLAFAGGLWAWGVQPWSGQLVTGQVTQAMSGATSADVTLKFGTGTLRVGSVYDTDQLLTGTVKTSGNEKVMQDYHMSGSTAYLSLESKNGPFLSFGSSDQREWDLSLNAATPTKLHVETGAGNTYLSLSNLVLTNLEINSGVGNTNVELPQHGQFQANIHAGVGDLNIQIPSGIAARIHVQHGLGNISVTGSYDHQGDTYVSKGYDTAKDRVELEVEGGVGNVTIR